MNRIFLKSSLWFCAVVVVLSPLLCGTSNAESAVSLTISEAIYNALDKNPNLKFTRQKIEAAEHAMTQAKSGYYPQLYLTETFNHTNNPMWAFGTKLNQGQITQQDFDPRLLNEPDAIHNFATALAMDWPVFDGGQTRMNVRQSKQNLELMQLNQQMISQDVIAGAASAYVGLMLTLENVKVVEQALATARAHLKLIRSRFESGFVVKSDLLRGQVRIAELEQELLQTVSMVEIYQARLSAVMGEPETRVIHPTSTLDRCKEIDGLLAEWVAKAMNNRPDLKQLGIQEGIAKNEITKTKYGHLPTLNFMGSYEINSEDFSESADNYTIGALARINLFSGYRISARNKEAKAAFNQVRSMIEAKKLEINVETQKSFLETQSAWKQIQVTRSAVAQSEEALRIVQNRYKNGLLTYVSLLDAETALKQARMRHFKSLFDYKVARIHLAKSAGVIDRDFQ